MAFWRSLDGSVWEEQAIIDVFTLENGKYGHPIKMNDVVQRIAGWDREEMYACPFTGHVYVTGMQVRGDFKGDNDSNVPQKEGLVLVFSTDQGKTWKVVKTTLLTSMHHSS